MSNETAREEIEVELHYMRQHQEASYFNTCLALGFVSLMRVDVISYKGIDKEVAHLLWKPKDVRHLTAIRAIIHMHQDEIYNLILRKEPEDLRLYLSFYGITLL